MRRARQHLFPYYIEDLTNQVCPLCDRPILGDDWQMGHEPPVARGLATKEEPGLIRREHPLCNARKSDRLDSELELPLA